MLLAGFQAYRQGRQIIDDLQASVTSHATHAGRLQRLREAWGSFAPLAHGDHADLQTLIADVPLEAAKQVISSESVISIQEQVLASFETATKADTPVDNGTPFLMASKLLEKTTDLHKLWGLEQCLLDYHTLIQIGQVFMDLHRVTEFLAHQEIGGQLLLNVLSSVKK